MFPLAIYQLAESTINLFRDAGKTIGTVESCTGGLVAGALTEVPGSSDVFVGGVIAYANRIKNEQAEVPKGILTAHGAVSEDTARAMAIGGKRRLNIDVVVAVTGVAGPEGGSNEKPVGLVHIAAAGPHGVLHQRHLFSGDREAIRIASVEGALQLARAALEAKA